MRRRGEPLTREQYLAQAYPEGVPNPLSAEEEMEIPEELRGGTSGSEPEAQ
jgi:hypothetical protein